jgi:hypothetical protein
MIRRDVFQAAASKGVANVAAKRPVISSLCDLEISTPKSGCTTPFCLSPRLHGQLVRLSNTQADPPYKAQPSVLYSL